MGDLEHPIALRKDLQHKFGLPQAQEKEVLVSGKYLFTIRNCGVLLPAAADTACTGKIPFQNVARLSGVSFPMG